MSFKYNRGDKVYATKYKYEAIITRRFLSILGHKMYVFDYERPGVTVSGSDYEENLEPMEETMSELSDGSKPVKRPQIFKPSSDKNDQVSAPSHYANRKYQTILVMEDQMSPEAFKGYLLGNTTKYLSRAGQKDNTLQDLCKAKVYLQWLIEMEGKGSLQEVPSFGG